ncbi:hypothetical protein J6590_100768 [Homalodisca vitripennis]|nr:hypothetical protein J6590_100768 [Homalodisca vitripennis]
MPEWYSYIEAVKYLSELFKNLLGEVPSVGESLRQVLIFCLVEVSWLTLTSLPTSCSPAPALALATVRSGQTRSEKLTVFWLFSVLPVSPWLANSPTFGRVPVSVVSGTGAASLPNETTETKTECPAPCQCSCTGIQPECMCSYSFHLEQGWIQNVFLLF